MPQTELVAALGPPFCELVVASVVPISDDCAGVLLVCAQSVSFQQLAVNAQWRGNLDDFSEGKWDIQSDSQKLSVRFEPKFCVPLGHPPTEVKLSAIVHQVASGGCRLR